MKCPKCGVEYSTKVWKIHVLSCKVVADEKRINYNDMSYKELQKIAKDKGLKSVGVSKKDMVKALEGDLND